MKNSLRLRLTLTAIVLMAVFMGIAGFAIHRLYENNALNSLKALLHSQLYALLASATDDRHGRLRLPQNLPDPRFNLPSSGLYAAVTGSQLRWRSTSSQDLQSFEQLISQPATGESQYQLTPNYLVFNYGIAWEDLSGKPWNYSITLVSSLDDFRDEMNRFRHKLWLWLGGSVLVLLLVQLVLMLWGLKPLKRLIREVRQIEQGEKQQLSTDYPQELQPLTDNLNSLINHSHAAQSRYRQSLGDLAHSLKTPLALIQGARNEDVGKLQAEIDEQLPHIDRMVQYHLQKAAMMGQTGLAQFVPILPVAEKIANGLDKVYQERQLLIELLINNDCIFHGDQTDLLELMGNLMDNACKHARHQVIVSARQTDKQLQIEIADDGPGINAEQWQHLLQRGQRADELHPGHGLGLNIVADLVNLYKGEISYSQSDLGGALIQVSFK